MGHASIGRRVLAAGVLAAAVGVSAGQLVGQQPAPRQPVSAPPAAADRDRPLGYIYDSVPITQDEFGKFLMDRGGVERFENFMNIKIIEAEATRRGITVTKTELEAALAEDLQGMVVNHNDFVKVVLPKYGKSLYEWMEDVVRPRLLLSKMIRDEVKVEDKDLKIQFERLHGEKRKVQMIQWPEGYDKPLRDKIWDRIRNNADEFNAEAVKQPNPALASVRGEVQPISRHLSAEDRTVEEEAFRLKVGEVSVPIKTAQGFVVLKLNEIIPPNDKVTFETEKAKLYKAAFEERLTQEIPKKFAELKAAARPKQLYTGPSDWKTVPVSPVGSITDPGSGGIKQAGGTGKK